jgi:hypothetical protein
MREYSQLSEQQRIALRGRAQLGEVTTTVIHLKESKQFKVGLKQDNFVLLIIDYLSQCIVHPWTINISVR